MGSESLFIVCEKCNSTYLKSDKACKNCGHKPRPRLIKILLYIAIVIVVIAVMVAGTNTSEGNSGVSNVDFEATWEKTGFGSILIFKSIEITNKNPFDIKDIKVECDYLTKTGTKIDSGSVTIYEFVRANKSKIFHNIQVGFTHSKTESISCKITKLKK